ncbi:MAG: hypothetical protein RLY71_2311 [Pseudomonadota bacterium]|jgi:hypothetical protein
MENEHKIELLKLAVQIAAQDRNSVALGMRLKLPAAADSLTVTLAIAQELCSALATLDTPAKP